MVSVLLEEDVYVLLKKIAKQQSRSQGGQVEFLIKQEAEKLGIEITETNEAKNT